jgi:hypothetical protein
MNPYSSIDPSCNKAGHSSHRPIAHRNMILSRPVNCYLGLETVLAVAVGRQQPVLLSGR